MLFLTHLIDSPFCAILTTNYINCVFNYIFVLLNKKTERKNLIFRYT